MQVTRLDDEQQICSLKVAVALADHGSMIFPCFVIAMIGVSCKNLSMLPRTLLQAC